MSARKWCGGCRVAITDDGRGSWIDDTGGDGCGAGVHAPTSDAEALDRIAAILVGEWDTETIEAVADVVREVRTIADEDE